MPNLTRHEISLEKLESYLRTTVPEIALPLHIEQFTYGQVVLLSLVAYYSQTRHISSRIVRERNMYYGRNHQANC